MKYKSRNKGVCSSSVEFDLEDGIVKNVRFEGGCNGNLQGVSILAEGRDAREVSRLLMGVRCGRKNTSCPAQFALAIENALKEQEEQNA
ncbi:MAG: TIGR03905 family TSCPD domain-containing protein [Oscillospiraceae bacterium]|nr:TIGR03905 family TSCPD domain-containing protein [Oscillospiraceae bacterium]